ncbi:MAG: GEVED domain-containing protein [Planctomycetota bacterium]
MARFDVLEPRLLLSGLPAGDLTPLGQQVPYKLEFSVDIGSDTELSDPRADGDEVFDPGDVYWNDGTVMVPPGMNGPKDDAFIFGFDPAPKGGDPASAVPVGNGSTEMYGEYFDLDGHDQVGYELVDLLPGDLPLEIPIEEFPAQGVFPMAYLGISMDDDDGPGWPVADVPVTTPSMAGSLYGTTAGMDEVIEVTLAPTGGGGYGLASLTPAATETMVHPNFQPDPTIEDEDDDVDSLDVVELEPEELVWTFSADHEAHMGLDPADIYGAMGSPRLLVDGQMHLGLRDGTDVDAFEFVWLSPDPDVAPALAVLFSVDNDDPLTLVDESGGLDPRMIYASWLTGYSVPLMQEPLFDDIDAIANWYEPIAPEPETFDWGDAPDRPYPTLAASNGAHHLIMANFHLGAGVDPEPDGQPTLAADGDDNDGNDDEDGVQFTSSLIPGAPATVTITASAPGILQGWIDFNVSGGWGDVASEQVFVDVPLAAGPNTLSFNVPASAVIGTTYARFRFSSVRKLPVTGYAPDGEVEDYHVVIEEPQEEIDWGDAPDKPYPTLAINNGASHLISPNLFLGATVDPEPDGQPTAAADGDDTDGNDDEDGVQFTSPMIPGTSATVTVAASASGILQGWVDFNANGIWGDLANEQVFLDVPLTAGPNNLTFNVPAAAMVGPTFARFRFSSIRGLGVTGHAPDGEVEDYEVFIDEPLEIDWGDAPDRPYPTLAVNNGASHIISGGLFLGATVDPDPDGQPTAAADGDDNDGNDDEDGITFGGVFRPGATVPVTVTASAPGLLQGWIDFNGNGSWADLGEQVFVDVPLVAGPNALTITVPASSILGSTVARFRFSSAKGLGFTGQARDGEVEDYRIHIDEPLNIDWGDAPDNASAPGYPTLAANNGANHTLGSQLYLGRQVDAEIDGQPTTAADGDDINGLDDEDGVVFLTQLVYGRQAKVDVWASQAGMLDAWIDFNADGDWVDAGEQIFVSLPVSPGVNTLAFTLPAMTPGPARTSYARFRLSSAGGLAPTGGAPDGEVEDYRVRLQSVGSISGTKIWDVNADGVVGSGDPRLAGFTVYADINNNGQLDSGEPSAVTNTAGQYTLSDLAPGTYTLRQAPDPLWRLTAPAGGSHLVSVTSGQAVYGINFGDWMLGDLDFDQDVDADDIDLEGAAIQAGLNASIYDLNDDGTVDDDDLTEIVEQLVFVNGDPTDRGTHFGDADLDGDVDLDDFVILKYNFGIGSGWAQGDFDVDGDVDLDDFIILKNNFGATAAPPVAVADNMLAEVEPVDTRPLRRIRRRSRAATRRDPAPAWDVVAISPVVTL